ncbi:unnamed protein product [Prorocentrum cordatum]|uniref:Glycosyltransferase 61 catalytic domain-containing protein n=1 Tax=Prorocentrum cordatum TaxID=2364126 RepID=A0ABN9RRU1_9DINO|nr:unnamed protein product [Polarella glacialis]|mmetsp:Transcript_53650/g.142985  ORF Transcript_53650/g.142985 Transcript_53650/m.142985 type:complete len:368 (-) Transcript_53650:507-1610(-)
MLPRTRLATSRYGVVELIKLLTFLPLAASLALPSVASRRECKPNETTNYSIRYGAKPSGSGNLWEYYHFLIDFAPAVLHFVRNDSAPCKRLQVPGWNGTNKFHLALPGQPQRSLEAHFEFLLGQPLGLTIEVASSFEAFAKNARTSGQVDWDCHGAGRKNQWAGFPAEYFVEFRDHAWGLPGVPPAQHRDVVAVRRERLQNYKGPPTGCSRRCLDERFYDRLLEVSLSHDWDTAVVALENQAIADQIALFSHASVIIAQHGAALSNIIFAPPGTLTVEVGKADFPCYKTLSAKLGLPFLHFDTDEFSDDIAQGISTALADDVARGDKQLRELRDVIGRFVLPLDPDQRASHVRCPDFATCVGQQFGQ